MLRTDQRNTVRRKRNRHHRHVHHLQQMSTLRAQSLGEVAGQPAQIRLQDHLKPQVREGLKTLRPNVLHVPLYGHRDVFRFELLHEQPLADRLVHPPEDQLDPEHLRAAGRLVPVLRAALLHQNIDGLVPQEHHVQHGGEVTGSVARRLAGSDEGFSSFRALPRRTAAGSETEEAAKVSKRLFAER